MRIAQLLRNVLLTYALLCMTSAVWSQSITGVMRDASGQKLIGASVNIKGTTIGAVTDLQGEFKIDYNGNFPITLLDILTNFILSSNRDQFGFKLLTKDMCFFVSRDAC